MEFQLFWLPELSPGGGKRGGRNDEEGKNTICIINNKNQSKIKILSLARLAFGSKWRAEVGKE